MRVRWLLCGVAAAGICGSAIAGAPIVIPTNQNGADTEIREFAIIDNFGTTESTQQMGGSQELATRGIDTTTTATGDRSSVMYMKFDISGLPNHQSNPGFWADYNVFFRGYVRNTNLGTGRIEDRQRAGVDLDPSEYERIRFNVLGLEPGVGRYLDDDPNQANRVDRSGNAFASPHYKYNWDEGVGTGANNINSGITYVSAPGITPFCMAAGTCGDAYGDTDPDNIHKTLGVYDDFNSDSRFLGEWSWPLPEEVYPGSNRYPVGMPLEYRDANGNMKQLIFDAQDEGRSHITLMLHLAIPLATEAAGGIFTTADFLNFNYLFIPKEMTTLNNDNAFAWDRDGTGVNVVTGSPYSCNGSTGAGLTNCPGMTQGDNSLGAFSPQLIVRIPEPASVLMLAFGSLALAAIRRRK